MSRTFSDYSEKPQWIAAPVEEALSRTTRLRCLQRTQKEVLACDRRIPGQFYIVGEEVRRSMEWLIKVGAKGANQHEPFPLSEINSKDNS